MPTLTEVYEQLLGRCPLSEMDKNCNSLLAEIFLSMSKAVKDQESGFSKLEEARAKLQTDPVKPAGLLVTIDLALDLYQELQEKLSQMMTNTGTLNKKRKLVEATEENRRDPIILVDSSETETEDDGIENLFTHAAETEASDGIEATNGSLSVEVEKEPELQASPSAPVAAEPSHDNTLS